MDGKNRIVFFCSNCHVFDVLERSYFQNEKNDEACFQDFLDHFHKALERRGWPYVLEIDTKGESSFPIIRSLLNFDYYDKDYSENKNGRVRIHGPADALLEILKNLETKNLSFKILHFKPEVRFSEHYLNDGTFYLSKTELKRRIIEKTPLELKPYINSLFNSKNLNGKKTKNKLEKTKLRLDDGFRPVLSPYDSTTSDDSKLSSPPKRELAKTHKIEEGGHTPKSNITADPY
jgi:hypothetical protein